MEAIEQANLRIVDLKSAIKFKNSEARKLQQELSAERVSDFKDERKMRSLQTKINQLKDEVTKRLPDALEDAGEQLKLAKKAADEARKLLPEQKKLIPKIEEASKELLEKLKAAQKINEKLMLLNQRYLMMEKKTGHEFDHDGAGGFMSIIVLIEVLEREIGGEGRVMITYPNNFRI